MIGEARASVGDGVILFDGVCVLCSGWVRFVAERDAARHFRFTPIQSPFGRRLVEALGIDPADPDTNAVIIDGRALRRSDAAIAVLSRLPGWEWTRALRLLPRPLRDGFYAVVARNRYSLFGRRETCEVGGVAFADRVVTEATSVPAASEHVVL